MILRALDGVGGVGYLERQAEKNPVAFMTLVGKVLPLKVGGEPNKPLVVRVVHIYNTERHLLYVACTRARDYLLVTAVKPGSEFLQDLTQ